MALLRLLLHMVLATAATATAASPNPFTPKSAFLRYYARKVPSNRPLPSFLLSKLSPLSAAAFSSFLSSPSISLPSLCSSAALLCSNDLSASSADSNFANYGTARSGGNDSFASYSPDRNIPTDTFHRYSASSTSRDDAFDSYASDGNIVTANFTSYASSAVSGSGKFTSYARNANVPELKFTNYDTEAVNRPRSFSSYSDDTNAGDQSFASYSKSSSTSPNTFVSYAADSNVIGSGFKGYGEDASSAKDNFTSYGGRANHPVNNFMQYGEDGKSGNEQFTAYSDRANSGESSFQSYAKNGNGAVAGFDNYGHSFNPGSDHFKGYGEGSNKHEIGFTNYHSDNTTFKGYAKSGITFATYRNSSPIAASQVNFVNKRVEPGKFFRENALKKGSTMTMADIRDKTPKRSFLPRAVADKLPFSAAELSRILGMPLDSALGKAMADTVAECERPPSRGETKHCTTSAEDMLDFAVSVLGANVTVRSTENVKGSGKDVLLGDVRGIDGGNVTKSVSCHQSLFPYLVYYCHSVPKVRLYEADILDAASGEKINRGVAICHLDTSDWSPTHGAFVALGSGPGVIEVCHWIFEDDMAWTVAD